jgi:precorrin-4/cobalt-precorrin-4 C11-methyltransferase
MSKVYFVGAGPGDPELITVKGKKSLETADIIIYAGSLVNPELLTYANEDTEIYNSASMTLDEVLKVMKAGINNRKKIVRLHTGDPSIYGAIREQMDALEAIGVSFEVIPGVSSFVASAASIKKEFTLPGVSQTVILTRVEGRTKVPKLEQLDRLASHKTSMAIFLSVQMIDKVVEKLLTHYTPETKIAVIQKASWPDEKIVMGTLKSITDEVKKANITKTAQILVGDFLGDQYELSKLYDASFSHEYREAKK